MTAKQQTERKPTTVRLPHDLHQRAKIQAAKSGVSLQDVIESALKLYLRPATHQSATQL